jgi:hypothetical protein
MPRLDGLDVQAAAFAKEVAARALLQEAARKAARASPSEAKAQPGIGGLFVLAGMESVRVQRREKARCRLADTTDDIRDSRPLPPPLASTPPSTNPTPLIRLAATPHPPGPCPGPAAGSPAVAWRSALGGQGARATGPPQRWLVESLERMASALRSSAVGATYTAAGPTGTTGAVPAATWGAAARPPAAGHQVLPAHGIARADVCQGLVTPTTCALAAARAAKKTCRWTSRAELCR